MTHSTHTLTSEEIALDHTPLTFGKYRGRTPDDVSEDDPGYICWMYDNVKNKPTCSRTLYEVCLSDADYTKKDRQKSQVKELDPDNDIIF